MARGFESKDVEFQQAEADRLRDELLAMGVVIEDTRNGTSWKLST